MPARHSENDPPKLTEPPRVRRVLVVDDSKLQRKILSSSLKKWGFEVEEADSAEAAIELCRQQMPEIVVSDWMMPGMSGPEFCREFRNFPGQDYSYFILLTSKSDKAEIAQGLEAGADDFLTKPVDNHELRARIGSGERILNMQATLREQNRALGEALQEVERLNDALDGDLKEARKLQQSLVPERHKSFETCDVSLILQSCGYVGGDLVGFYPAGPDHLGLYAIDVSGHGISSALMTARLAGYLSPTAPDQNVALTRKSDGSYAPIPPHEVISILNDLVLEEMETEHYFTMLLADLNIKTGHMRLGQAGHPHPLLQDVNGKITQDSPGGLPVGLIDGATYEPFEFHLKPGDRVLFHSDGVTECMNPRSELLGEDGLEAIASDLSDLKGTTFFEALLWRLTDFADGPLTHDDVSAVLIDYSGPCVQKPL